MKNKKIYLCGPTVYNTPHIGNLRPIITFDIYARALEALEYKVDFIHNITDIDDKIINRSIEENKTEKEISEFYEKGYKDLLKAFNVTTVTDMPRVTDNIDVIIDFVEQMVSNNSAYVVDGDVYLDVHAIKGYGKLSNRDLTNNKDAQEAVGKKNPADFALWKKTDVGITFDSPWGKGRPGWHTECAAFIYKYFGKDGCDIHGGGADLLFPHHENENAQFLAMTNNDISKEWKHVGQLNFDGEKMSKSLGNVLSGPDFLDKYDADLLRYIFLTSGVTNPLNFTEELIDNSIKQLDKLKKTYFKAQYVIWSRGSIITNDNEDLTIVLTSITNWKFAEFNKFVSKYQKNINSLDVNGDDIVIPTVAFSKLLQTAGFNFSNNDENEIFFNDYKGWMQAREDKNYALADQFREKLVKNGKI